MSCIAVDGSADVCANCGKGSEGGSIKLKHCTACRLVKYCGVDCQRAHRKQHEKACKQRAAELKGEQLYSQGLERPEGHFCPICTLAIPLPMNDHSIFNICCMKRICDGCNIAAQKRGMRDCLFCRAPLPEDNDASEADQLAMVQARVAKKDPEAIHMLGEEYYQGGLGLRKDMPRQSNCGQRLLSSVRLKHSTTLDMCMSMAKGFKRTRLRLSSSTQRRPCKDIPRAGTFLAGSRGGGGTTTVQ